MKAKFFALLLLVVVLATFLVACGVTTPPQNTNPSATAPPLTVPAPPVTNPQATTAPVNTEAPVDPWANPVGKPAA